MSSSARAGAVLATMLATGALRVLLGAQRELVGPRVRDLDLVLVGRELRIRVDQELHAVLLGAGWHRAIRRDALAHAGERLLVDLLVAQQVGLRHGLGDVARRGRLEPLVGPHDRGGKRLRRVRVLGEEARLAVEAGGREEAAEHFLVALRRTGVDLDVDHALVLQDGERRIGLGDAIDLALLDRRHDGRAGADADRDHVGRLVAALLSSSMWVDEPGALTPNFMPLMSAGPLTLAATSLRRPIAICMPRPIRTKPLMAWPRCCMRSVCS